MAERIIEHDTVDMYKSDQAKYSVVVNRRRSLPAIQDGLKPVQKRILYAAYTKHLTDPNHRDKSTALYGEVLGKYHAHGECIFGETPVLLTNQTNATIEELYKIGEPQEILAVDPVTLKVVPAIAHSFRIGQITKRIYHIKFSNGYEIQCTNNHPFMLPDGEFIKAEDINLGLRLLVKYLVKQDNGEYSIDYNEEYEYPFVKEICAEYTEPTPMYDFTVDGLENMLIPISEFFGFDDVIPMISAHNSSVYDAMATMVQWFSMKYPILHGKGNWGNSIGDGTAAGRYTECALSNFGYDVLIDDLAQSSNIVDWIDTYKRNGEKEPEYLPAKLPLLLINGAFGIGVGIQCSIPSHNLGEVVDATIALIKNPNTNICLVPDLTMPCELIDTNWQDICNTGSGSFRARGLITTEQDDKGNYTLHIRSLPHQVNGYRVKEIIETMISNKQLPMVKDLLISLGDGGMPDIIIKLRPGADPEYVKHVLYSKAQVQTSVRVNFEIVSPNGIDIQRYSYKDYLLQFIDMRRNIKFRLYCNKLQQDMTAHYKVDALAKVLESGEINTIIEMIRKYKGTDDGPIIEFMIKKCNITDIQAKYIISVNLSQLSAGHLAKYKERRKELEDRINQYTTAVTDDGSIINAEIVEELLYLKKKYNTPRLCTVIPDVSDDNIPAGTFKIVITERNYIRKVPDSDKVGIVRKDNPKFILRVDNRENILLFDNKGKVFKLPVSKIPISDKTSVGTDIRILSRNLTADIAAVYDEEIFKRIVKSTNKHYLVIVTRSNTIKKLDLEDFLNVNLSGLIYSKIKPEDEVVGIALVPHNLDIVICSGKKALRCSLKDVPLFKRNATGSRAMSADSIINGLSVFYPNTTDVVAVTKNGFFNRFPSGLFDRYDRGRKGVNVLRLGPTDEIIAVYGANENDKIRVLTSEGIEEVAVADIKSKSTVVVGTKMLKSKGVIVRADIVN